MTVLIAHRLSTVMHADRIYVLERAASWRRAGTRSFSPLGASYYAMWRQQVGERRLEVATA